jgi:hypothetical protein
MSDTPLPAASLRLAGHVGQATLDWIAASGTAPLADLDQHIAAVREALDDSVAAGDRRAAAVAARAALDARVGAADANGVGELLCAMARSCPDVLADDAGSAETGAHLPLLLHYICGFLEQAVTRDWWPGFDWRKAPDWESMRLAAVCVLITETQAATNLDPDLHAQP